jgi:hypothetical protein
MGFKHISRSATYDAGVLAVVSAVYFLAKYFIHFWSLRTLL